MICQPWMLV
ncbi:hypothetical protein CAEBREN_20560 [Caenorhabditis brenneri]|uniref:Uncharacterized protein n=1 Tax=Caenorhabditis brenneri TaxID=135651 RepID=G0PNW6_CAEBE|nr:hypothetical protein CAEBREN_20560 [Caenorhabditis brenneri]